MFKDSNLKVTVIVPVYNVEKFLSQCIESIISQTFKNLEIILVNDGSTDNTDKIAEEYAKEDKRIKIIHKTNEGVSIARNIGIDASNGDYVCFVDGDDFIQPDYVEYLLNMAIENNANIALTTEMYTTFHGDKFPLDPKDSPILLSGEDAAEAILYYKIPIGCYCKIFKREFLGDNIRFYPSVFVGEGFNFNVKAFQLVDKVVVGSRKVYCYRRDNPASCMTQFQIKKSNMALKAIDIIRENLLIKSNKLYAACDFADWHTHGDMYNWIVLAKVKNEYLEDYKKYKGKIRSYSHKAIFAPIKPIERFRAIVQLIHPRLLASLLEFRRWKARLD